MTLKAELEALRARIEGNLSPPIVDVMRRSTQDLLASGIRDRVLPSGVAAPTFDLHDQAGNQHSLSTLLSTGPLAVTFYRGFWCPYCNADLEALQGVNAQLQDAGVRLVAISPEKPEYSRKIRRLRKLEFDILHDQGNQVAEAFGVRFEMSEELRTLYRNQLNINLALYNDSPDWALPIPARFLIDEQGTIRYTESCPDYTHRPEPQTLVDAARSL